MDNKLYAHKKKYRIVSKLRFCIFLTVIFILFFSLISSRVNKSRATDYESFINVYVEEGDTLWTIAKRTLPDDTDIRDYIYQIKSINGMKGANIKAGEILIVPVNHP